jgi:hypothetical protein
MGGDDMKKNTGGRVPASRISKRSARVLGLLLVCSIMAPMVATGFSEYEEQLPDKGLGFECQTCHNARSGGGSLNAFGTDFGLNDEKYDEGIAAMDSDGDGFTNGEELTNVPVTNPGDASSFPTAEEGNSPSLIFLVAIVIVVVVGLALIWGRKH